MCRHLFALVALVVASFGVAAPVPKALKHDDRSALIGEWEEPQKKRAWWFKQDGTAGGGERPDERTGRFRIDPTTHPKQLDWSSDGGKTWQLGVYTLQGDVLTVNMAKDTKAARPESTVEQEQTHFLSATRKK
ncbi:MAG: hypothetical protein MUF18_02835 [Fimbriiglobus sp.]|jgi:uncharacterized protein (TIGR03067 family)|nr:hypothetical protein [Fimbriiglobus sp.]